MPDTQGASVDFEHVEAQLRSATAEPGFGPIASNALLAIRALQVELSKLKEQDLTGELSRAHAANRSLGAAAARSQAKMHHLQATVATMKPSVEFVRSFEKATKTPDARLFDYYSMRREAQTALDALEKATISREAYETPDGMVVMNPVEAAELWAQRARDLAQQNERMKPAVEFARQYNAMANDCDRSRGDWADTEVEAVLAEIDNGKGNDG